MREIDRDLLNARRTERESIVRDGIASEKTINDGRTLESMVKDAKEVLGLSGDDIIEMEYEKVLAKQNDETNAFSLLSTFLVKAEKYELVTDDESKVLNAIQDRMAKQVCERFDLELEDLYGEE